MMKILTTVWPRPRVRQQHADDAFLSRPTRTATAQVCFDLHVVQRTHQPFGSHALHPHQQVRGASLKLQKEQD